MNGTRPEASPPFPLMTCPRCGKESINTALCPGCDYDFRNDPEHLGQQAAPADAQEGRGAVVPTPASNPELSRLQAHADLIFLKASLRGPGVSSIVFGILTVVLGTAGMNAVPIDTVLTLAGILLIGEGIWLVVAPSPLGVVVDGIALLVVGAWDVGVTVLNVSSGGAGGIGFLGAFQIFWGIRSLRHRTRFAHLAGFHPDRSLTEQIKKEANEIRRTDLKKALDTIEFKMDKQNWRARLGPDFGVFVAGKGPEILYARPNEVDLNVESRDSGSDFCQFVGRIGRRNVSGIITAESLKRYQNWRPGTNGDVADGNRRISDGRT